MDQSVQYALLLVAFLAVKHAFADFVFQSRYILDHRRVYGHPGGILHAAIHGACSVVAIFAAGGAGIGLIVTVASAEAVAHYHIDWSKDNLVARLGLTARDRPYWYLVGADQTLHHLTYVAMAAILTMFRYPVS